MIMFLENILASEALWTHMAKMWKWPDFSSKANLPFLKNHWLHFIHQGISRFSQIIIKTYGNVNCCVWFLAIQTWKAENAKKFILVIFVFCITFDSSQNNRLNFLLQGLSQQFCTRRASFNIVIFGNDSYIGKSTDQNSQNLQKSDFSPEPKLLFSETAGCISSIRISIDIFLPVKSYLIAKQYIRFFATETWWAKNWILVWFVLIIELGFPESSCQDFFRQGLH